MKIKYYFLMLYFFFLNLELEKNLREEIYYRVKKSFHPSWVALKQSHRAGLREEWRPRSGQPQAPSTCAFPLPGKTWLLVSFEPFSWDQQGYPKAAQVPAGTNEPPETRSKKEGKHKNTKIKKG